MLLLPTAVTESSATIDATVANTGSVREFMTDFKIVNGFEPTLAIAETSPQQCPAVDMLLRLDAHEPGNLILRSALAVEKAGERVRLQIEGVGQRTLSLVVVHEDGVVQDLTAEAKQSGNSIVFEGRIDGRGPARPSRKLVLAFAGPHRPSALDQVRLMPPDQLLKSLHQDLAAMGEGLSTTARIVRFE
jgi:hypothetical protein